MSAGRTAFQEIGWNGIRFSAPSDWQVSRIGSRYLFLENPTGPALEVKWGPVRGRFSPQRQLRRLASMQTHASRRHFRQRPLPPAWEKALAPGRATPTGRAPPGAAAQGYAAFGRGA